MRATILTVLLLLLAAAPGAAQSKKALLAQLASETKSERQRAYAALAAEQKMYLSTGLARVTRLRQADIKQHAAVVKALRDALKARSSSRRRGTARKIARWHTIRAKALKLSLDEEIFPNPGPKKTIRGPYTGYSKVMPSVAKARRAYAALEAIATQCLERLDGFKGVNRRFGTLGLLSERIAERAAFLRPHRKPRDDFTDPEMPFLARLAALAGGRHEAGLATLDTLVEPDRTLLFLFYGLRIHEINEGLDSGMTRNAVEGVRRINRERMALGVLPLEANKILTRTIVGHLKEMRKLGFRGHFSPTPGRRRVGQRAHQEGWEQPVGEGLSSTEEADAPRIWAWDGGHYRLMIHPKWTHIGMGYVDSSGINVGVGERFRFPRPTFFK